jgi:hypothetical protein
MRALAGFVVVAALLAPACRTYPIRTTDLTLQPGGHVHVHGKALHVKVVSRGRGLLTISVRDAEYRELGAATLGIGTWTGGDGRATDVWIRNESAGVVHLDVSAGGSGQVAVSSLAKPVEGR